MTTIDELKARKKELQARRQEELALQAAGKGDNMTLFMVEEELMDVNAQLRALTPGRRVGRKGGCISNNAFERGWSPSDSKQFLEWDRENNSFDDEIAEGRVELKNILANSRDLMTPRQWEIFEVWSKTGMSMDDIARRFNINKSTVSRTLRRAKAAIQEEAERKNNGRKYLSSARLDMSDPNVSKIILACMTETQAVYVYLYYGEWMTLREISALTGTDKSSIMRAIYRALANIGRYLGYREIVLENMDAVGEIAFRMYVANGLLEDPPEHPTKEHPDWGRAKLKMRHYAFESKTPMARGELPPISIRRSYGEEAFVTQRGPKQGTDDLHHGPLLDALLRQRARYLEKGAPNKFPVFYWLRQIFSKITGGKHRKRRGQKWEN